MLLKNKQVALAAMQSSPGFSFQHYQELFSSMKKDRDVLLTAVKRQSRKVLHYAHPSLRDDKKLMREVDSIPYGDLGEESFSCVNDNEWVGDCYHEGLYYYGNFREYALLKKTTMAWILLNLEGISANEDKIEKFKTACKSSQNCLDDNEKRGLLELVEETEEYEVPDLLEYLSYLTRKRNTEKA